MSRYAHLHVRRLRRLAKLKGIPDFHKLKQDDLIEALDRKLNFDFIKLMDASDVSIRELRQIARGERKLFENATRHALVFLLSGRNPEVGICPQCESEIEDKGIFRKKLFCTNPRCDLPDKYRMERG